VVIMLTLLDGKRK